MLATEWQFLPWLCFIDFCNSDNKVDSYLSTGVALVTDLVLNYLVKLSIFTLCR